MLQSFEIENIEKRNKDWLLDIDILPNRAHDCFSHIGVAREAAVLARLRLEMPKVDIKYTKEKKASDFVQLDVKDKEACLRYTATVIFDVKVKDSPGWLKQRLVSCGLQSINNIVDITNYVMLETGQPLHAFDLDKLGERIVIRRAKKGERLAALDDKTYQLDKDILVVADRERPVAIAGIKGGKPTGIDEKTKRVVIEAGNWHPVVTRRASRKLKLRTDASTRFENDIDPNLIDFAQERARYLIQELAGGRVMKGMADYCPRKTLPRKVRLDLDCLNRLLGIEIARERAVKILTSLGFQTKAAGFRKLLVTIPTRRRDIQIEEDLIEEVGRIYGYQNIPSQFPKVPLSALDKNEEIYWKRKVKYILKELGFCEVYNYSFFGDKEKEVFSLGENKLLTVANPFSALNKYLRSSLTPHLLRNIKDNFRFFDEIKIFELGKVFSNGKSPREARSLAVALSKKKGRDGGFYELKGVSETMLNGLGVSDVWFDEAKPTPEKSQLGHWHPNKRAEIKSGDLELGFLGEVNPEIVREMGIKERVFLLEIDFACLLRVVSEENEFAEISPYPASVRDIAVLVPLGTTAGEILEAINSVSEEIVSDVDLFDVYSGRGVPEEKENFAFHIVYQARDRTLSSQEIDKVHREITEALEARGWEVRK